MGYKIFGRAYPIVNPKYNPFEADTMIKNFQHWELRQGEIPYEHTEKHMVLWEKTTSQSARKLVELYEILNKYRNMGYTVLANSTPDRSVLKYDHYHIIRFISYSSVNAKV